MKCCKILCYGIDECKQTVQTQVRPLVIEGLTRPQCYKTIFMLILVEHENLNAHDYKIIRNSAVSRLRKAYNAIFPLINIKTIFGILTFMSRKNFILS